MKILMVCLGNICRSPLAEGILRSKISEKHTVASAGTNSFHEGEHPDKRSTKIAKEYGVDISHQRANYFTEKHLEDFDKIFCMDLKNLEDVLSKAKSEEQRSKVSLIMEEAGFLSDEKIEELLAIGGTQILFQGGVHPNLKIDYYESHKSLT